MVLRETNFCKSLYKQKRAGVSRPYNIVREQDLYDPAGEYSKGERHSVGVG